MASEEDDVVKISFANLEHIVQSIVTGTHEDGKQSDDKKQSKSRRPAQQIYRPGQLKQGKGHGEQGKKRGGSHNKSPPEEDWDAADVKQTSTDDDTGQGSRESSGDINQSDVTQKLDDLHIDEIVKNRSETRNGSEENQFENQESMDVKKEDGSVKPSSKKTHGGRDAGKRRGKRPDLQIYVPRARLDRRTEEREDSPAQESNQEESKEEMEEEEEHPGELVVSDMGESPVGSTPRKVQVKSKGGAMRVTVMNESLASTSPSSEKSFPIRAKNSQQKEKALSSKQDVQSKEMKEQDQGKKSNQRQDKGAQRKSSMDSNVTRAKGGGDWHSSDYRQVKSYMKTRRSNSSDSRGKESEDVGYQKSGGADKGQFSSETFPRAKPGSKGQRIVSKASKDVSNTKYSSGNGGGREGERFYWGMRRQRTGSISSEASAASNLSNGSFYSGSSDLGTEDDEPEHILNWGEEVEKAHLEELARIVHDGAQKLTSSLDIYPSFGADDTSQGLSQPETSGVGAPLNRQKSISADRINQITVKGTIVRPRRRQRHRKNSSQQGSRDSSVHSNMHGDDGHSEGGRRRRRRRRRHSSQSSHGGEGDEHTGWCEENPSKHVDNHKEASGNRPGLQVTIGKKNRHVEYNRGGGASRGKIYHRTGDRATQGHESDSQFYMEEDWDQEAARSEQDSNKHHERSFRKGQGDGGPGRWRKESGEGGRRMRRVSGGYSSGGGGHDADRHGPGRHRQEEHYQESRAEDDDWGHRHGERNRGQEDKRSIHPAHDASSRVSMRGRGRSRGGGREREDYHHQGSYRHSDQHVRFEENRDDMSLLHKAKGGGLLRLPMNEEPPRPHSNPNPSAAVAYPHPHHQHPHHDVSHQHGHASNTTGGNNFGSNVRGPTHGKRQLFDPKNPSKPIVIADGTTPPKFEETDMSPSPGSHGAPTSSPNGQPGPYPPPIYPPEYAAMFGPRGPMPPFPGPRPFMGGGFPGGPMPPPHMFFRFPRMPPPDMAAFYNCGDPDSEGFMNSGNRAQCRMMAEQILQDSTPFESQLGNILSRRPSSDDSFRMVNQIRAELQNRLEQVILLDIDVANKHNVEQTLWKGVYYQVIETLRRRMSDDPPGTPSSDSCKERLTEVLDEGTRFFENLLTKLQSTYGFELDTFTDGKHIVPESVGRLIKLALLSAQRIMMFLGDIARYREQLSDCTNYGKARQWYLKAQRIHPRNGRPYNQLAILAVYTRRKLDAVYFYMRSLAASNPILTARESLMSLFDEVRRKVDAVEKKKFEERHHRQQLRAKRKGSGPRIEIWVSADGTSQEDNVEEREEEEDFSSLSPIELNKRFVLTYLNVHGKLFTKINFEMFAESSSLMLQEFWALLQHSPCVLSSTRLLQLMVINMFSIDNTALRDESLEDNCRSLLQEHAVETGLEMFGLLVQRSCQLLKLKQEKDKGKDKDEVHSEVPLHSMVDEDLYNLLPALKTWVDWMMCHAHLWNPQPLNRPPDLGPQIDVWKNVATFCDLLNSVETKPGALIREQQEGYEPVLLQEDTTLAGFVPMLSAPQELFYAASDVDKTLAEAWLRIEKLRLFGEYLCGVEPPMLAFNVDTGCYYSVAPSPVRSEENIGAGEGNDHSESRESDDESDDVLLDHGSSSDEEAGDHQKNHIERLKAKKAELHKQREERQQNKENMEAILEKHRHAKIELEIHPIFLIPDTNCFIDHFILLKKILESKKYNLIVPLVVINELDGLARGARDQQYDSPDHAVMVKNQASAAIEFLEEEFDHKNSHLRALTAKGTVMDTISFRSEESDGTGINDDIILSCCLHYCKDMAREFMPKDKDHPVRLRREVVLLTEDRNLRLKAHTHNVPVKDVPSFKKWSKIS